MNFEDKSKAMNVQCGKENKMKTAVKSLIFMLVILMSVGVLTSCPHEEEHVHDFSSVYYYDENYHWIQCDCSETSQTEAHSGGEASCVSHAKCAICGQSYGELQAHEYTDTVYDGESHWNECVCGARDASVAHSYKLMWNENEHWSECSCGAKIGVEAHKGGTATCTDRAVCEACNQSYGVLGHIWNDGELTTPATEATAGTVTYTCKACGETKSEVVPTGTKILTRADIEDALVSVAWAYYMKETKIQYDSDSLSKIGGHWGGTCRHTRDVSPEFGTSDTCIYSVCTGYPTKIYHETLGRCIWEEKYSPNGVVTLWFWVAADNQPEDGFREYYTTTKDPLTENDRDTAIVRWADYAKYIQDEQDELPYAESLGTFDSTSFFDWYQDGTLEYRKAEGETAYSYYLNGKKITPAEARTLLMGYLTEKKDGEYVNVRPGDVIVEDGHAFFYIGNGYAIDCKGFKYDINTGVDGIEESGALAGPLRTLAITLERAASDFIISRPLDYYTKDYDGDPGNDIIKFNGEFVDITEATESRMEYLAMEIDRTVDITPYGTAEKGGTLTYTVKVSNKSNESNYQLWMRVQDQDYSSVNYQNVVITERIPEGTELVSATVGYTLTDGVLSWTVDIDAAQAATISYTVRVTAEVGSVITSEGGTVAKIPSNSISNTVGCSKLTDAQKDALTQISQSSTGKWKTLYGTDLAFAEGIYAELGIKLELPTVKELVENLFTPTLFEKQISMTVYYNDKDTPIVMFVPQTEVSEEYSVARSMLLDRYCGGYRFFATDLEKFEEQGMEGYDFPAELDKTILEFRFDYLEVGDIIVYAKAKNRTNTGMTSELASTKILIYVGNNTLIEMTSSGAGARYTNEEAQMVLNASFKYTNDIFFLLRPSQVMDMDVEGS